jgi:hypothetical protein
MLTGVSCGMFLFLCLSLCLIQSGLIGSWYIGAYASPAPAMEQARPSPGLPGSGEFLVLIIITLLVSIPIMALGGAGTVMMSKSHLRSRRGSIVLAAMAGVLSYVVYALLTVTATLALDVLLFSTRVSLLSIAMVFWWSEIFIMIALLLALLGVTSAAVSGCKCATRILKLNW